MKQVSIRELREIRGITQAELGEMTGNTQANISKIETHRKFRLDVLEAVVEGFGDIKIIATLNGEEFQIVS